MKLNKLFLMAVMGLGLFACSENELEGNGPEGAQNEGTTYVGFTLKFNDANTRAEETGTEAEQKINKAYVIMADADGNVEQIVSTANKGTGDSNKETDYYVIRTNPGLHYFYAVVNPDQTDGNDNVPTVGGTISSYFNTAVPLDVAKIASVTDASFMMASHEVLTANVEDGVTENEALKGTKNCFTIKVERATAKVTMTCDNETLTNSANKAGGGTIKGTTFTLKNGASMSYRMAQASIKEISENENTYDKNSDPTLVYIKGTDPSEEVDYIYRSATPVYCLENLHNNYYQKNTTYVDIETTFTPAKVVNCLDQLDVNPDNNLKNNSTTGSFFVVRSGEHAQNYLMKSDLLAWQKSKKYVENQSNEISKNPDHFPAGVESISEEYVNGKCFFGPIWIGQETADASTAPVTRNTWYNLKITGITLPGEPSEPQIDPEQTLTPATNVAITLTVMPWNFIDRGITLQ